jgi:hypothetical protein
MKGSRLLILAMIPLLVLACAPRPEEPEEPPVLPTVSGLVLRDGATELVSVNGAQVTGELTLLVDEETPQISVIFIDDLSQEFTPTGFSFGASTADGDIAGVVGKSGWTFRLAGRDDGETTLALSVNYEGSAEYSSPAIPVSVERILSPLTWLAPDSLFTLVTVTPLAIEVAPLAGDAVTRVSFAVNGTALSEDTSAPFTAVWDPVRDAGPGIYGLEAMGYDAEGGALAADTLYVMVPDLGGGQTGTFGGSGDDRVYDMVALADGSVVLAGEITMPNGGIDATLIKVGTDGQGWFRAFGGSAGDHLRSLRPTADGGFIACGWTWRAPSRRGPNFWLLKLDADGFVEWDRVHGETDSYQYAHCVRPTADGGYIVAGSDADGTAAMLLKTDAQGQELWRRAYAGNPGAAAFAVEQTDDDGYLLTGRHQAGPGSLDQLRVIRTNSTGSAQWSNSYSLGGDLAVGRDLRLRDGGGLAVLGGGDGDIWFLGLDDAGDEEWSERHGGVDWDQGHAMLSPATGGFLLTGFTTIGNDRQLWLALTDETGDLVWNRSYGETGVDEGHALAERPGGYFVAGVTESGAGGVDIRLLAVDGDGERAD